MLLELNCYEINVEGMCIIVTQRAPTPLLQESCQSHNENTESLQTLRHCIIILRIRLVHLTFW